MLSHHRFDIESSDGQSGIPGPIQLSYFECFNIGRTSFKHILTVTHCPFLCYL